MKALSNSVAHIEAELEQYKEKSIADDNLIDMLKQQNARQASEIAKMQTDHANEMRETKQRCDLAVAREREIAGGLHVAARGIMKCLDRLKNGDIPEYAREPGTGPVTDVAEIKSGAEGVRQLANKMPAIAFASDRG